MMQQADSSGIIRRVRYTRALYHSPYWHPAPKACDRFAQRRPRRLAIPGGFRLQEADFYFVPNAATVTRVVFLSDLHWNGRQWPLYTRLADAINALRADWIAFGGDLSVLMDTVHDAMKWLATLQARHGKLAVLGNRESLITWLDHDFWHRAYADAGFHCLINESFATDNSPISFYGVDDARFGHPDWNPLNPVSGPVSGPGPVLASRHVISLSHNPDAVANTAPGRNIGDMVLCGHTHGGQFVVPLFGPIYTSSAYGRQFVHGWQQRDDGVLCHTSSGIGESACGIMRHRLFCPRELLLLHLWT